ncbi:MAG: hypothetical protein ACREGR_02635 [Minisyncoccia bacterium]
MSASEQRERRNARRRAARASRNDGDYDPGSRRLPPRQDQDMDEAPVRRVAVNSRAPKQHGRSSTSPHWRLGIWNCS